MIIFNSIPYLKNHLTGIRSQKKIIGFVPTMGALHQGHISLIELAQKQCDIVICSIFVNPTQFNNVSDLLNYPRTLETDCILLEKNNCDLVFAPEVLEIYNPQELALKQQNIEDRAWAEGRAIDFGILDKVMEGAHRPGHFNGVAQIVSKLFRIVEPHNAYFGQKDFQQLAIIKSMVHQLEMPVEVISCPIVREKDGLAMSSRNVRLTTEERTVSSLISKTLFKVKEMQNNRNSAELKTFVEAEIKAEPLVKLEYFEIADLETLQPIDNNSLPKNAVACIAVHLGSVRLIDNVILK